jgi:hypothetical protein
MREHAKVTPTTKEAPHGKRIVFVDWSSATNTPLRLSWRGILGRRAVTNTNARATLEWDLSHSIVVETRGTRHVVWRVPGLPSSWDHSQAASASSLTTNVMFGISENCLPSLK